MKKVQDLIGPELDYWVAKLEGYDMDRDKRQAFTTRLDGTKFDIGKHTLKYSTDWSQGGPILNREWISTYAEIDPERGFQYWVAVKESQSETRLGKGIIGPTKLIAGTRCFVASRFGDEVEDVK